MKIEEFVELIQNFDEMANREKIRHFAWYIHTYLNGTTFGIVEIRKCFDDLHLVSPNLSQYMNRMATGNGANFILGGGKYKLRRKDLMELNGRYLDHPSTIVASKLLSDLPEKISNIDDQKFLEEAINCYKIKAFRASVVMTWNLAYDYLARWVIADHSRLSRINIEIGKRSLKGISSIVSREDIEKIKEFDFIEITLSAGLISSNIAKILKEKLTKRNIAAHPSSIAIAEPQANDVIYDLVNNIVLALK